MQTDRQADIVTYGAAITGKKCKIWLQNYLIILATIIVTTYIHYQKHNTSIKLVAGRPTDIKTYRAAIAAKKLFLLLLKQAQESLAAAISFAKNLNFKQT